MTGSTHQALWAAVVARSSAADGLFVYAVRSTGIVCRPSCPSRRPARHRVEFFPRVDMALLAGYRPCKRCRPDVDSAADAPLLRVCRAIQRRPEAKWASAAVATAAGVPASQVRRAFRRLLDLSPRDYVLACRRRRFLHEVRAGRSVAQATYASGFESVSQVYGPMSGALTPASYGRGGEGATVSWTTGASPIGRILVAATARGVCFVAIGAGDDDLERTLAAELPRARLRRETTPALGQLLSAAASVASAKPVPATVPADIAGTAFEWRIWRALTKIPRGQTLSYQELAAVVGHPKAVRAVGRACGANPLALIVPCHRVIGSDGALRGYRWGLEVKAALLRLERD